MGKIHPVTTSKDMVRISRHIIKDNRVRMVNKVNNNSNLHITKVVMANKVVMDKTLKILISLLELLVDMEVNPLHNRVMDQHHSNKLMDNHQHSHKDKEATTKHNLDSKASSHNSNNNNSHNIQEVLLDMVKVPRVMGNKVVIISSNLTSKVQDHHHQAITSDNSQMQHDRAFLLNHKEQVRQVVKPHHKAVAFHRVETIIL